MVLAFDSFKGSLSAADACASAATAIAARFGSSVETTSSPMADGGEGSLDLLGLGGRSRIVTLMTTDAIERPLRAEYFLEEGSATAHIEVARICGLTLVADVPLRPLAATTYGVGIVAAHALEAGARRIVLYLGGTASTDAGKGMLMALGVRFDDAHGDTLAPGGGSLVALASIEYSDLLPAARAARWTMVTDVDAPLTGPTGAAQCYAAQKGASATQIDVLERSIEHAGAVVAQQTGRPVGDRPGTGAAGGLAAFADALLDVEFVRGSDFFAELTELPEAIARADLVLTGEGRFDAQSLDGKVVGTVAALARAAPNGPPVVVLAGSVDRAALPVDSGVAAAFSLADGPALLAELTRDAAPLLGSKAVAAVALALSMNDRLADAAVALTS
ncbi:glycerate kinase [Microbacteriaceae bacterium VKM Ac-2855]|nr:glycerate kinase [Microbacteriaceae bacterium VKM Ac-2855]